jgi:SAM-dependent methyltransferase
MTDRIPRARAAQINRQVWAVVNEQFTDRQAEQRWASPEIVWGIYDRPERDLGVLGDLAGLDVVELGCGTAYFSGWLARAGAHPIGVDVSAEQLRSARRCQDRFGRPFGLIQADATAVPLADGRFDLALSEYGASLWCEPDGWIGEAARLLRPGGRLVFLTSSPLVTMCVPDDAGVATPRLQRGQPEIDVIAWDGGGVEYHPGHGELLRILRAHGFIVEMLHELHAPAGAALHEYYEIADPEWGRRWPVEDLWVARLG